ncbi:MAG: ArsC/Spx/MgsR family protein [Bacteriovoracaceae bacterium]
MTLMAQNPVLMERPILFNEDKAMIGRPPENLNQIL